MKKFLSVAILAFSFIIFAHSAQAFEVKVDNSVNLNKEEIADGNVYASCSDMKIDGTVNGDVIAMCKNIIVNGTINGDLIAFSQNIIINGEVKGSARIAGTNITINGTVDHNINAFGTEVNLTPSSTVAWDVLVAGVNGKFNGTIAGNLHGSIASANIGGKIGKNINLSIEDGDASQGGLLVTKDAIIGGGLTYTAQQEAKLESLSSVVGPVSREEANNTSDSWVNKISKIFYELSALILIGLVFLGLKKKMAYDVAKNLETKNWQATLIGVVALFLTPIIILFFIVTIIGIPLAIILLAAYLILIAIGIILASFFVGNLILKSFIKKPLNVFLILITGLTIFVLLALLPYLGWSFILVFMVYGLGGILFTVKNYLYD
jgi:cytoskeletal protein CcmA (bactofilin family)